MISSTALRRRARLRRRGPGEGASSRRSWATGAHGDAAGPTGDDAQLAGQDGALRRVLPGGLAEPAPGLFSSRAARLLATASAAWRRSSPFLPGGLAEPVPGLFSSRAARLLATASAAWRRSSPCSSRRPRGTGPRALQLQGDSAFGGALLCMMAPIAMSSRRPRRSSSRALQLQGNSASSGGFRGMMALMRALLASCAHRALRAGGGEQHWALTQRCEGLSDTFGALRPPPPKQRRVGGSGQRLRRSCVFNPQGFWHMASLRFTRMGGWGY
jgi:hypothetical protein